MDINRGMARFIAIIHIIVIVINSISVPLLIAYQPIYVWMPLITLMLSPYLGGTYCQLNQLENYYREKAGMPLITDRLENIFRRKK